MSDPMDLEIMSEGKTEAQKDERARLSMFQLSSECNDSEDTPSFSFLHDSVALGNFETHLLEEKLKKKDGESEKHQQAEVERLPLFMRVLSKCRPLSNVSLSALSTDKTDSTLAETNNSNDPQSDKVLEEAVRRLEDRAAIYSVSEGVEVVSCHLAPYVCRRITKLPPLKRQRTKDQHSNAKVWDTTELVAIAQNPSSSRFSQSKRRKLSGTGRAQSTATTGGSNLEEDDYDEDSEVESSIPPQEMPKRKRISSSTERDSMLLAAGAAEDSQEAFVTKTLSEVALLVAEYLQHENKVQSEMASSDNPQDKAATEDGDVATSGDPKTDPSNAVTLDSSGGAITTSTEDSILAQARVVSSTTNVGGITGSDLGATVASLFHHSTVLMHSQTAAALCRAEQPQTPHLLRRLAANCPPAIPALVKGCLGSLRNADSTHTQNRLAKSSVLSLSRLSQRECLRIQNTLRFSTKSTKCSFALLELQLELSLERNDPVDLACFLIQHLSSAPTSAVCADKGILVESGQRHQSAPDIGAAKSDDDRHGPDAIHTFDDKKELSVGLAHLISTQAKKKLRSMIQCISRGLTLTSGRLIGNEGRLSLVLRASLWLLLSQENISVPEVDSKVFTAALLSLLEACQNEMKIVENWNHSTFHEEIYSFVLACLTLWIPANATEEATSNDLRSFQQLWETQLPPLLCSFRGCVALALSSSSNEPTLRLLLLRHVGASTDDIDSMRARGYESELKEKIWCQAHLKLECSIENVLNKEFLTLDTWPATYALETTPGLLSKSRVQMMLEGMLFDRAASLRMLRREESVNLINRAVVFLTQNGDNEVIIPVVSPLHLEMQASALPFAHDEVLDSHMALYVLQLIYCFAFKESYPQSPFSFDPRTVPLKQIWILCEKAESIPSSTRKFLRKEIVKNAPEIIRLSNFIQRTGHLSHVLDRRSAIEDKTTLKNLLFSYVSKKELDPSGFKAEGIFHRIMATFSEQDITSSLTSAFFLEPRTPPLFVTHRKLCEDPLTVLKCPLKDLWARPGLRRVALFLLSFLLDANTALITGPSRGEDDNNYVLEELLAARDMLVIRCLISSAYDEASGIDCSTTVGFVRWTLSNRKGLGPFLLRQGIFSEEFDWLVYRAPELMSSEHQSNYLDLFSEQVSLPPAERLSVAAFVVKLIVLYGQQDEEASGSLILSALSQLISGFFVLVGPSGVAVSALLSDSDNPSMNATQIARQAALRTIRELPNVRSYRSRLRSESSIACQKLYRLCKGEELVAGLSVSNSSRQKAALREIQDAVSKALAVIGVN